MRLIFVAIILLSASMAANPAQAEGRAQRPPMDGYVQTPTGPRQPTKDDLNAIENGNKGNDLPASHDDITGAVPLGSDGDRSD